MSITGKKIAFIGAGNMAEALINGLLSSKIVSAKQITAFDVNTRRLNWLKDEYKINISASNTKLIEKSDVVILAVKPQILSEVLEKKNKIINDKLVISIAAGISTQKIESYLSKKTPVIRVMPNMPAVVCRGATAICRGKVATKTHAALALDIFRSVGYAILVEEKLMDMITAVSGSGPAYVFYLMEAMIKSAIDGGLPKYKAINLVAETVRGAGELVIRGQELPGKLRKRVTSPGGTTEAAIKIFDANKVNFTFLTAISAAEERSKELSN
ncbi:MAG: pyrroline-5-carboxylate reductase [Chlamydiae bacterium]|nr:MAG: pyrroline-5-carboxylate reductase [Chlamydiota bacterium]